MAKRLDVIGHRYGMLTVIADAESKAGSAARRVLCRCDCGAEVIILLHTLRGAGNKYFIRSCGCIGLERRLKLPPELRLVQSIFKQASKDYRFLRRKGVKQSGFRRESYSIAEIEDFFKSEYCDSLLGAVTADISGKDILRYLQCRSSVRGE